MSLIPKQDGLTCNTSLGLNIPQPSTGKIINCRNSWFREFWIQHNKCTFNNSSRKCSGYETIAGYEQEGLVPFVGKPNFNYLYASAPISIYFPHSYGHQ